MSGCNISTFASSIVSHFFQLRAIATAISTNAATGRALPLEAMIR